MTQEQLLDHVCELVTAEAKKGPGLLLLIFDDDFRMIRVPIELKPETLIVDTFRLYPDNGLIPPSRWLSLSKKLWHTYCSKTNKTGTVKFDAPKGAKHVKPPGDTDDPGGRKPA